MSELQDLVGRQQMVSAMIYAAENAAQVIEICSAPSRAGDNIARRLASACGLTEFQAEVILDMQVKRFSPLAVEGMRAQLEEDERIITRLRANGES